MRKIMFNFSDIKLACLTEKLSKDNQTEYQYKLGPYPRPVSTSLYNRLDSNTNLLKEVELSLIWNNGIVIDTTHCTVFPFNYRERTKSFFAAGPSSCLFALTKISRLGV